MNRRFEFRIDKNNGNKFLFFKDKCDLGNMKKYIVIRKMKSIQKIILKNRKISKPL